MQSLASIKSKADEITKATTNNDVKLLAKLVSDLTDLLEEVDNKAKQAYAETRRLKSELRRTEHGPNT